MPGSGRDLSKPRAPARSRRHSKETLTFLIEVEGKGGHRRIVARAASNSLARAIFEAACAEFPGRALVLRNGDEIVARRSG